MISFIVGLSISGQTFYTFILENLEKFGALKAIGTKSSELIATIFFQAAFTALTGYGLGVGLCAAAGRAGQAAAAGLCGHDHLLESAAGFGDGGDHRRTFPVIRAFAGFYRSNLSIFSEDDMPRQPSMRRGLEKWFGEGEARTMALRDVSLETVFGEMVYIVGPSGSGKTTLLSVLSGILRPDAGSVSVEGTDIWNLNAISLPTFRLNKIGFVFQDFHLFPRLNTAENVAIPLILRRKNWDESIQEATKYLDIVGLKGREDLPPVKLSGGEQQRVAIARAIAGQPDILIMDEPTASLDGDTGQAIVSFVNEQHPYRERCIIVVTHDSRIYDSRPES